MTPCPEQANPRRGQQVRCRQRWEEAGTELPFGVMRKFWNQMVVM